MLYLIGLILGGIGYNIYLTERLNTKMATREDLNVAIDGLVQAVVDAVSPVIQDVIDKLKQAEGDFTSEIAKLDSIHEAVSGAVKAKFDADVTPVE